MKKLIVTGLLLAPSCTQTDSVGVHEAVAAYLKKNLNDPASYEAVQWGVIAGYSRKDSATAAAKKLSAEYDHTKSIQAIKQAIRLEHVADTTRIGTRLTHTYRAKNKLGALVLDSAQFVVYRGGKVQQL